MLKVIKTAKDLVGYQEKMAEFYVKYIQEKWGIIRDQESISDYIYHTMLIPFRFSILSINEKEEIVAMTLAYPANYNNFVSSFPESTISLYANLFNVDQEVWKKFLEEMAEMPFRNVMTLEALSFLNEITVSENFKIIGDVEFPVKIFKENHCIGNKINLLVMKKIISPQNMHTKGGEV